MLKNPLLFQISNTPLFTHDHSIPKSPPIKRILPNPKGWHEVRHIIK
jgi:hypothetical protein